MHHLTPTCSASGKVAEVRRLDARIERERLASTPTKLRLQRGGMLVSLSSAEKFARSTERCEGRGGKQRDQGDCRRNDPCPCSD